MSRLRAVGLALAVLALGLPWGAYAVPGYVTTGYYTSGYCDYDGYCYSGTYQPGYYVPGFDGSVTGTTSTARFFVVGAVLLVVLAWRLGRPRLLLGAASVCAAGVVLHLTAGLTGGTVALALAAVCFGLAARRPARL
ncbi:hypothetical protein G5V58_14210 [Nocardioides anomalus]|uniref:Uncharacterized protein n=1 Tax=Nocardioides anomalus TaxID=2712223 RepID=A0A6G6WF89_9ACTN|nr:hypothetical protein [Nocardioides anomalus]QIG43765.1 hypothetical protein G5V58_14210 [Nocardioides anomalus]